MVPNPKLNLGALSAGLGGSEVVLGGLGEKVDFVVVGVAVGVFTTWGPILEASDGAVGVEVGVTVDWGCLGCSAGLDPGKGECPDPVLVRLGKGNTGFVVEVLLVVMGVGWLAGIENV